MGRARVSNFFQVGGIVMALVGVAVLAGGAVTIGYGDLSDDSPGLGAMIAGSVFLSIGVIWAIVGTAVRAWYGSVARRAAEEADLFQTGERATGVIEAVDMTGVTINDNPQVLLRVRVRPRYGDEFTHERKLVVPASGVPLPGRLVEVAFARADRTRLALQTDPRFSAPPAVFVITREAEGEAAAGGRAPSAPAEPDPLDRIEQLARLRESGALTEAEFQEQKAKLLAQM